MKATAMKSQVAMANSITAVSQSMGKMNAAVDMSKMTKDMQEFARANEVSAIREEMMDDMLGDAFDGEGVEEGADEITNQVLAELGLEADMAMSSAPSTAIKGNKVSTKEDAEEQAAMDEILNGMPEIKARLQAL
jgi:charged multivesicular body protein 2B